MIEKVVELIDRENWPDTAARLVKYAHHEICKYYWRGYRPTYSEAGAPNANGKTPSDFLGIALHDIALGKRSYNEDVSLETNLRGVIRSNISNAWKKQDKQPPYAKILFNDQDGTTKDPLDTISSSGPTSDYEIDRILKEQECILDEFAKLLEDDDDLGIIFLCEREGIRRNAIIEEKYGIPADRVSELKRKLERRKKKFLITHPDILQKPLERNPQ